MKIGFQPERLDPARTAFGSLGSARNEPPRLTDDRTPTFENRSCQKI